MQSRDFCFWLQGFFEVSGNTEISATGVAIIRKHLNLVFTHEIDPSMGKPAHQIMLNEIHNTPIVGPATQNTPIPRC